MNTEAQLSEPSNLDLDPDLAREMSLFKAHFGSGFSPNEEGMIPLFSTSGPSLFSALASRSFPLLVHKANFGPTFD